MNASTHEELAKLAQDMAPDLSGSFYARAPDYLPEPTEAAYQLAREERCKAIEDFASFLEIAEGEREPSAFFGLISTVELAEMLLNERAEDFQLAAAARELRERFLADDPRELQRLAYKAMEY